jgi:hypothetical protein
LSSRPERTRISCRAALETIACAAFSKESRMKLANATHTNRNPGERSGGTCGSADLLWRCFDPSLACSWKRGNSMDLISLYQAQVKAISNLHCQKIICSANLDSSEGQPSLRY